MMYLYLQRLYSAKADSIQIGASRHKNKTSNNLRFTALSYPCSHVCGPSDEIPAVVNKRLDRPDTIMKTYLAHFASAARTAIPFRIALKLERH